MRPVAVTYPDICSGFRKAALQQHLGAGVMWSVGVVLTARTRLDPVHKRLECCCGQVADLDGEVHGCCRLCYTRSTGVFVATAGTVL